MRYHHTTVQWTVLSPHWRFLLVVLFVSLGSGQARPGLIKK